MIAQFHLKVIQFGHKMELCCTSGDICKREKRLNFMLNTCEKSDTENISFVIHTDLLVIRMDIYES